MGGSLGLNAYCFSVILFQCFTLNVHIFMNLSSLLIKLTAYNSEVFDFWTTVPVREVPL